MYLVFEIMVPAVLSPTVRLDQVQVDGFAWLSQRDHPSNTGLTVWKETANRRALQLRFRDQQRSGTKSWRVTGKQEKSILRDKKAMVSSCGCIPDWIPIWGLSFLTESWCPCVETRSRRKILVSESISMSNAWPFQLSTGFQTLTTSLQFFNRTKGKQQNIIHTKNVFRLSL